MGIDTDIRTVLIEEWAIEARLYHLPQLSKDSKGTFHWDDSLCRMHQCYGPRFEGKFTGKDAAMKLFEPALKKIYNSNNSNSPNNKIVYMFCIDDDEHVPKEKLAELTNRTKTKILYPLGAEFCDEGITLIHNNSGLKQTELMDLERVLNTRALRKKLWQYCLKHLHTIKFPKDAIIIFNFKQLGPYVIYNGEPPRLTTEWAHALGETDLSLPFWLWLFRDYDVILHTVDTDIIPITFSYIAGTVSSRLPKSIVWEYEKRTGGGKNKKPIVKTPMLIDMYKLCQRAVESTKLNIQQFVLACILCKTDFYNKRLLTHGVSAPYIFQAIMLSKDYILQKIAPDVDDGELGLELYIRIIHMLKIQSDAGAYNNTKINVLKRKNCDIDNNDDDNNTNKQVKVDEKTSYTVGGRVETFVPKSLGKTPFKIVTNKLQETEIWTKQKIIKESNKKYPSIEDIKEAYKQLSFNLEYWLRSWQKWTIKRPFPERCDILFLASVKNNSGTSLESNMAS